MRLPAAIDKTTFVIIYVAITVLVVWSGRGVTNYALDTGFYRNYLIHWEARLMELRHKNVSYKPYDGRNPQVYMQSLIEVMQENGLSPPVSNTEHYFVYDLNKFGDESCRIMLLFHQDRLMLFGLPHSTFRRLDRIIDGVPDSRGGAFTGTWSSDNITKIGTWKI